MKKLIVSIVVIAIMLSVSIVGFTACKADFSDGDNLVSFASAAKGQTMKGFGASSAWWSQIVGQGANKDEVAELLYGDSGMALNIYRYNIGGGSLDIKDRDQYWELDRLTESFLVAEGYDGDSHDALLAYVSDPAHYDFSRDAGAQEMLKACYALGNIDEVILFVNSPHYLMTKNHMCRSSNGADNVDNLAAENYDVFAAYLMVILKHFVDEGYPVKYLSPINEPNWDWSDWKQEGCHYEPASCAACLEVVNNALMQFNTANGTAIKIDGFESGNWRWKGSSNNPSYNQAFIEAVQATNAYKTNMDMLSFHSYSNPYKRSDREDFMKKAANYNFQLGISEYCQMTAGVDLNEFGNAQLLALVIAYDLSILKSNEWTWWIGVSNEKTYNYEDGLIYTNWWSDYDDAFYADYYGSIHTGEKDSIRVSPRYYTMKHYANFVDAGDVYLDLSFENEKSNLGIHVTQQDNDTLFYAFKTAAGEKMPYSDKIYNAFMKPDGTVVVVYTNVVEDPMMWTIADKFKTYEAYTSTKDGYMVKTEGKFDHTYSFAGNSITTLVLHP